MGANHPFPRNAALCRLRFTEVANHGARAVIDSKLSFYSDQTQIYSGQTRFVFCFVIAFRRRRKTCICELSAIADRAKAGSAKTNRPDFSGENSLFSPLAISKARSPRQSPFSARICALPLDSFKGREPKSAVFGSLRIYFF